MKLNMLGIRSYPGTSSEILASKTKEEDSRMKLHMLKTYREPDAVEVTAVARGRPPQTGGAANIVM